MPRIEGAKLQFASSQCFQAQGAAKTIQQSCCSQDSNDQDCQPAKRIVRERTWRLLVGGHPSFPDVYLVATITSVDFITAVTTIPFFSFIRSADSRVITETSSADPISIMISAITLPSFTDLILPLNWLRALIIRCSFLNSRLSLATEPISIGRHRRTIVADAKKHQVVLAERLIDKPRGAITHCEVRAIGVQAAKRTDPLVIEI